MLTCDAVGELRERIDGWRRGGARIGFVPTMGNLHAGHLSLVEHARAIADRVVVSIFVNPTQFGEGEDFSAYPRTMERDSAMLRDAGVDLLFAPDEHTVYPLGAALATQVHVPRISAKLDGKHRPGHFDGVATVVCRLFMMVDPDIAVFGRKDYQQLLVIRQMSADLSMRVRIDHGDTVREPDGLALSSRNQYLTSDERALAPLLHATLGDTRAAIQSGRRDFKRLRRTAIKRLNSAGFRVDYVAVRAAADLSKPDGATRDFVVLAAAWLGRARLIDNVVFSV
jgi:pantoate--beta-alanine ligase